MDAHENARTMPHSRMLIIKRLHAGQPVGAVADSLRRVHPQQQPPYRCGTVPHQSAMKPAIVRVQRRRSSIEVRSSKACAPSPFGP